MAQASKVHSTSRQALLRLRIQGMAEPEIVSYISLLKKKYRRYAMPADEARKVVDTAMGEKLLTDLLEEVRG